MKKIDLNVGKEYKVDVKNDVAKCTITAEQLEKAFSSELALDRFARMIKSEIEYKDIVSTIMEEMKL